MFVYEAEVGNERFRFIKGIPSNTTNRELVTKEHFPINTRVEFIGIDKVPLNDRSSSGVRTYELPKEAKYAAVEIAKYASVS